MDLKERRTIEKARDLLAVVNYRLNSERDHAFLNDGDGTYFFARYHEEINETVNRLQKLLNAPKTTKPASKRIKSISPLDRPDWKHEVDRKREGV